MRADIYLIYLLLRLLALLPLRVLHGLGAGLGRLLLWRRGRTARNTAVNLAHRPARAGCAARERAAARGDGRERQVGHRDHQGLGRRRRARAGAGARGAWRGAAGCGAGGRQGGDHRRAASGLLGAAQLLAVPHARRWRSCTGRRGSPRSSSCCARCAARWRRSRCAPRAPACARCTSGWPPAARSASCRTRSRAPARARWRRSSAARR